MRSKTRTMMFLLIGGLLASGLIGIGSTGAHEGAPVPSDLEAAVTAVQDLAFDDFVDESYRILLLRDPDSLWYGEGVNARELGLTDMATFTDVSLEGLETTHEIEHAIRSLLVAFDRETLSPDQRITYDSYLWLLDDRLAMADYPLWNVCIGPSMYGLQGRLNDLLAQLPIESLEDAQAYVHRLKNADGWFDQWIDTLRSREAAGVIPARYELTMSIALLDNNLLSGADGSSSLEDLPAYTIFQSKLAQIPDLDSAQRSSLLESAREAVVNHVIPGFQALREHLVSLQATAADDISVSRYDGGADYFAALIRHHTTADATADEIYQLGIQEVACLQQEMRDFATSKLRWPANLSMASLDARLENARAPFLQGNALLAEYKRLLAEADAALDTAFAVRPSAGIEVRVDINGCSACYAEPGSITAGMGYMMTSLVNVGQFSAYDEPVLVHHESIPGHHYQIALALDLDVPLLQDVRYRSDFYQIHPVLQAFSEGWALYAEQLAAELGLYDEDPVGYLLSLRLRLYRVARLVVQAGIHAYGWSWDEAADYLEETLGVPQRANGQLLHISYPGQACSYNMMFLAILDMRQHAMDVLGDKFDLKAFHQELLRHGIIPLQVLEGVMEDWMNGLAQS